MNYHDAAYKLLAILQDIAPNGKAQELCAKLYRDNQLHAEDDKELLLMMTNMLHDGLSYGNWPWTVY